MDSKVEKCKICGRIKPVPPTNFKVEKNLLHDLCWRCNVGLDAVNYDAERLIRIAEYLEKHRGA